MPVPNPDGSTGVTLHVDQTTLGTTLTYEDDADFGRLESTYDDSPVVHTVLLADLEPAGLAGRGEAPGMFAVVDATYTDSAGGYTFRTTSLVHELLHNVLGRLDERNQCPSEFPSSYAYHSCEGWLSYDTGSGAHYLPDSLAAEMASEGLHVDATGGTASAAGPSGAIRVT
jgi:hypothetical protein